jgi:hypothetical protein
MMESYSATKKNEMSFSGKWMELRKTNIAYFLICTIWTLKKKRHESKRESTGETTNGGGTREDDGQIYQNTSYASMKMS